MCGKQCGSLRWLGELRRRFVGLRALVRAGGFRGGDLAGLHIRGRQFPDMLLVQRPTFEPQAGGRVATGVPGKGEGTERGTWVARKILRHQVS